MQIRKATESDVGIISSISKNEPFDWGYTLSPEWFTEQMEKGDEFFLLTADSGTDVGYTSINDKLSDDVSKIVFLEAEEVNNLQDSGFLHMLGVHKDHNRKGYGSKLIQHGINQIKDRGKEHAYFFVYYKNNNALAIYLRKGFEIRGVAPNLYGEGEHRILMRVDLAKN